MLKEANPYLNSVIITRNAVTKSAASLLKFGYVTSKD